MDKFIENASNCAGATNDNEQKELKKEGHNRFVALTFMHNSDHKKCRVMSKNPRAQHALGNNQCLKTLMLAVDAPKSHEWDEAHNEAKKNGAQQRRNDESNND